MLTSDITADILLNIYAQGCFPMADSADDADFGIYEPHQRSILPIKDLHVSKSLRKRVLKDAFEIRINTAFSDVIDACGGPRAKAQDTWINASIKKLFNELHDLGHAHSVEAWKDGELVGGLYGLQIGAAFCGESMFSRATDASKVALVHLCARLAHTGFTLLDAQLNNPHLDQFGQTMIEQQDYLARLYEALQQQPSFITPVPQSTLVRDYLQNCP